MGWGRGGLEGEGVACDAPTVTGWKPVLRGVLLYPKFRS